MGQGQLQPIVSFSHDTESRLSGGQSMSYIQPNIANKSTEGERNQLVQSTCNRAKFQSSRISADKAPSLQEPRRSNRLANLPAPDYKKQM